MEIAEDTRCGRRRNTGTQQDFKQIVRKLLHKNGSTWKKRKTKTKTSKEQ